MSVLTSDRPLHRTVPSAPLDALRDRLAAARGRRALTRALRRGDHRLQLELVAAARHASR